MEPVSLGRVVVGRVVVGRLVAELVAGCAVFEFMLYLPWL